MAQAITNSHIQNTIIRRAVHGPVDTRTIIQQLSSAYAVSKQCISGNISWLVSSGCISISRNGSDSYLY